MERDAPRKAEHLLPAIYDVLLGLAWRRLARHATGDFAHPAELVHEAYLRVVGDGRAGFEGCGHLFFAIDRAMRDLVVESFRRRATVKRGGDFVRVELAAADVAVEPRGREFLDLERALRRLARDRPHCAQVVVLSYHAGLTHPEIARALCLSLATVERRLQAARAWLQRELAVME